jgi:hypothetical protein
MWLCYSLRRSFGAMPTGRAFVKIARAVRLPRTSVHRTIQQYRAAQQAQSSPDDELTAESAAVLAKYGGGFDADEFDIADAPTELPERFERMGIDLTDEAAISCMAKPVEDPADALANWRVTHLPRTAEWRAGHDKLGRPLAEAAELNARIAAGWRHRNFSWHRPARGV